jgi:RNA ligase (TIGR02306 family)
MESILTDTTRKLASVQIIKDVVDHTNSDNLALAQVLGWQVVVKRNEFKPGDKIIYFEIDSLLPQKSWSEFLKSCDYKVKTIKLRGEISQGLIMPLSILDEHEIKYCPESIKEGENLTSHLGIGKYKIDAEEPITIKGGIKIKVDTFPSHIIEKTDEPRIQSEPKYLSIFEGKAYYATLKYDGTSGTYFVHPEDNEFYICSRNNKRDYTPGDVYSDTADAFKLKEILGEVKRYAIQCEIYGPSIQCNPLNTNKINIAVFNIFDLVDKRYLEYEEFVKVCNELGLPMVEIVEEGESFSYTMDELKLKSKGTYPGTKTPREGLVYRLKKEWRADFKRHSFKVINDDFLLGKKK